MRGNLIVVFALICYALAAAGAGFAVWPVVVALVNAVSIEVQMSHKRDELTRIFKH